MLLYCTNLTLLVGIVTIGSANPKTSQRISFETILDFDLFVIHNRFVSKKIHSLNLFEVFRLRKLMRPFAASDIFYMDCELEIRTTTTSGWAQNFCVGRSVATERIVFRSRILSEYSIHVPLEGHFVRLSHDRVSCV